MSYFHVNRVAFIRPRLALVEINTPVLAGSLAVTGYQAVVTRLGPNVYLVYPFSEDSIFWPDRAVITNTLATWRVTSEDPLDGSFEYFDSGGFIFTKGAQTGVATFSYEVMDYDGNGNDAAGTWSHTVT